MTKTFIQPYFLKNYLLKDKEDFFKSLEMYLYPAHQFFVVAKNIISTVLHGSLTRRKIVHSAEYGYGRAST